MKNHLNNMLIRSRYSDYLGDDPHLPHLHYQKRVLKFGTGEKNDVIAKNIINNDHGLSFDVYIHQELFWTFCFTILWNAYVI